MSIRSHSVSLSPLAALSLAIIVFASAFGGLGNEADASLIINPTTPTVAGISTTGSSGSFVTTGGFSSEYRYQSAYAATNLFGKTGTAIGATPSGTSWAASGISPTVTGVGPAGQGAQNDIDPVVSMDFGSAVSANSIVFAQRDASVSDDVTQIEVWFLSAPFTESFTPGANSNFQNGGASNTPGVDSVPTSNILGSEIIPITNSGVGDNNSLTEYIFPDLQTLSGRYVVAQLFGVAPGTGTNNTTVANPGGLEFALAVDSAVPEPAMMGLGMSAVGLQTIGR